MDIIHIKDLEIWANHGVFPEENALGQKFVVCADLFTNVRRAGLEDALEHSIDYGAVSKRIKRFMEENTCMLIESVAEKMAACLLQSIRSAKCVWRSRNPGLRWGFHWILYLWRLNAAGTEALLPLAPIWVIPEPILILRCGSFPVRRAVV